MKPSGKMRAAGAEEEGEVQKAMARSSLAAMSPPAWGGIIMHQFVEDVIWTIWPGFPGAAEAERERMAKAEAADTTLKIIVVRY